MTKDRNWNLIATQVFSILLLKKLNCIYTLIRTAPNFNTKTCASYRNFKKCYEKKITKKMSQALKVHISEVNSAQIWNWNYPTLREYNRKNWFGSERGVSSYRCLKTASIYFTPFLSHLTHNRVSWTAKAPLMLNLATYQFSAPSS